MPFPPPSDPRRHNPPYAAAWRSLAVMCARTAEIGEEVAADVFAGTDKDRRESIVAKIMVRCPDLLGTADRDELAARLKAVFVAAKLSEPLHFPPLRQD